MGRARRHDERGALAGLMRAAGGAGAALLCACNLVSPLGADAADGQGDTTSDLDAAPDQDTARADGEGDAAAELGGPLTLVVEQRGVGTARICDLDGDDQQENAFADLGSPDGELAAMAVSGILQGHLEQSGARTLFHIPWIENRVALQDSDVVLALLAGVDVDNPVNPEDDFSGNETFLAEGQWVDACGEPLVASESAAIEAGRLMARFPPYALFGDDTTGEVLLNSPSALGTVEPGGGAAELAICGFMLVHDLGAFSSPDTDTLSLLELLIAGGAPMGVPTIRGLSPDIDVDGDGLERFGVDAEGHLTTCVDGDGTASAGPDCWRAETMADGISITFTASTVSARLSGLEPSWQDDATGTCADPPEQSLWDPR